MKRSSGRIIIAGCALAGAGALLVYSLGGFAQAPAALVDVGRFRVGASLGEERAGFSGRPKLQVFTDSAFSEIDRAPLDECLRSPEVGALLGAFTPILIDVSSEPDVEADVGAEYGFAVIVRGINGKYLGGLPASFTCEELVALLQTISAGLPAEQERSPLYTVLLESQAPIQAMLDEGDVARAAKCVDFLKEFEGEESPATLQAAALVGQ